MSDESSFTLTPETRERLKRQAKSKEIAEKIAKKISNLIAKTMRKYPDHREVLRQSLEGAAQGLLVERDREAAEERMLSPSVEVNGKECVDGKSSNGVNGV